MTIYLATTNAGKLRDFRFAAEDSDPSGFNFQPLPGIENMPAPDETGDTFEANARLKAEYYSRLAPGLWVLADDSGLEVDALDGRPGVRSARYATDLGFPVSGNLDADNNDALLLAMLEQTDRTGRYRCALALAIDGRVEQVSFGKLEGEVQSQPSVPGGFGYDPLFFVPELDCTMSACTPDDRQRVSHRGRALRNLLRQWRAC
ncbi:MAG: non-canonical purine NTP pyrophosphatase [Janthinobacterium lividum]